MNLYLKTPHLFSTLKNILFFVFSSTIFNSQLIAQSSQEYNKAQKVVNSVFQNDLPKSYLLFSIESSEYVIVEKEGISFKEHFVELDKNNTITNVHNKVIHANTILNRAFNKDLYYKDYIDVQSPYFTARNTFSGGKPIYFYYKDEDGIMYGEAKLTTIIYPNPIDLSVFGYLLNELQANI